MSRCGLGCETRKDAVSLFIHIFLKNIGIMSPFGLPKIGLVCYPRSKVLPHGTIKQMPRLLIPASGHKLALVTNALPIDTDS